MPVYVTLGIGCAYAISYFPRVASLVVVMVMVLFSALQVWVVNPEAVLSLKELMNEQNARYSQILNEFTETDALVFAGNHTDKWTTPIRRTAVTWSDGPSKSGVRELADATEALYLRGQKVYFVFNQRQKENLDLVNQQFASRSLMVENVPLPGGDDIQLWKVAGLPNPIKVEEVSPGVYDTQISAPGSHFTIEIDSSIKNHITNSSFENGLQGW
jgi:hypothetical protein